MEQTLVCPDDLSFSYFRSQILGSGGNGYVFKGEYEGIEVAVKRVLLIQIRDSRGETALLKLKHENIVKLYHYQDNPDFRFFALELCAADLDTFCKGKYSGPIPSDVQVLLQLAKGLDYIHSKDLVHRDVKPQNILISKSDPVVMKWADFGLTKPTNDSGSCSMSGFRGTLSWVPHEILRLRENQNGRGSKRSDIFSTGCVFFYFLTRGVHPFGHNHLDIQHNISNQTEPMNISVELVNDPFMKSVIIPMTAHKSKERIKLAEIISVLENPPPIPQTLLGRVKTEAVVRIQTGSHHELLSAEEYIISIKDLLEGKRKKSGWVIQAHVTEKSEPFEQEISKRPDLPPRKCFFVILKDESGYNITAKASTGALVDKFYPKFEVGKQYFIKKAELKNRAPLPPLYLCGTKQKYWKLKPKIHLKTVVDVKIKRCLCQSDFVRINKINSRGYFKLSLFYK